MNGHIYTVGHSTRAIDEFVRILDAYRIELVVDVRTIAKSRHNPQFDEAALRGELPEHNIRYVRLPGLGGLRHTTRASANTAWKNVSFRGYADYMQTAEFARALEELISLARERRTAILCAEAVPWRCHRSLIGDALLVRGFEVEDILGERKAKAHSLTPWAKVQGERITYPGPPPS